MSVRYRAGSRLSPHLAVLLRPPRGKNARAVSLEPNKMPHLRKPHPSDARSSGGWRAGKFSGDLRSSKLPMRKRVRVHGCSFGLLKSILIQDYIRIGTAPTVMSDR